VTEGCEKMQLLTRALRNACVNAMCCRKPAEGHRKTAENERELESRILQPMHLCNCIISFKL